MTTISGPVALSHDRVGILAKRATHERSGVRDLPVITALLVICFGSLVYSLTILPLHFDEEVHLTRAIEVWRGHPFWEISDGRIINQWAIAAFYPQNAPVFVARIASVLVELPGLAAGYTLARNWFGRRAGTLALLLMIGCPYLFFYDRTALIDGEVGALGILAVWACLRLVSTGKRRDAVLAGLALAVAMLFKFTVAPFGITVALLTVLLGKTSRRQRIGNLVIIGLTVLVSFAIPVLYAVLHHGFNVATGWLVGSGGNGLTLSPNFETLWAQFFDYGSVIWAVMFGIGLVGIVAFALRQVSRKDSRRKGMETIVVVGACALPLVSIFVLVAFAMPRHYAVGFPILLTLAGAGLGVLIDQIPDSLARVGWWKTTLTSLVVVLIIIGIVPFALTAYTAPEKLPLPPIERGQYLTGYSAGFGLREAMLSFPQVIGKPGNPIIASMYPDGCRLANFYDKWGYHMLCQDAPGLEAIQNALSAQPIDGMIFVLSEAAPIGVDPTWLMALPNVKVIRLSVYPRPGETLATASVVLWQIQKVPAGF